MNKPDIQTLVDQLTLEEQVSLLAGDDNWSLPPVPRLGIGKLRVTDGPNGARGSGWFGGPTAAAFPVGIALGATWNPELAAEIGVALAQEAKTKSAHVLLGPTVNIHRSVTNGRNFECYSEDPELTAAITVGYIRGLQGAGVAATIKHFAGNESEIQRATISSEIDERTLREVYLRPFEAAAKDAGTWAVMSAYNKVNGTYASENRWLLTEILRGDWGFDGVVMSDWFGSHSTVPTVNAGLDLEMPGPTRDRGAKLVAAVRAGDVAPETVRESALNVLRLMERTGALWDDGPFVERAQDRPQHRALIRRAGAEGTVLLKNDGLLPLAAPEHKIAVIGPNARDARIMGGGSSHLNPHYRVSPWQGLVAMLGDAALTYAPGCTNHRWEPPWQGDVDVDYFANRNLEGAPVHSERMPHSQAFWVPPIADGKIDPLGFSARLQWTFVPGVSGTHRFGLHSAGYSRLYVDGTLVANAHEDWTRGRTFFEEGCDEVVGEMELEVGRPYQVSATFVSRPRETLAVSAFRAGIGRPLGDADLAAAVDTARAAETALLFVGRSGEWDTEGSDLESIRLPGRQNELIEAVLDSNPRTVVVLQTGGPVEMPWIDKAPAVLQAWYPGQECGNAIADVLFGEVEPSGRLPQSFPVRWADNPTHSQDPEVYPGLDGTVRYEEGVFIGYRHYDQQGIKPLFPFGHGLGYTAFELSGVTVSATETGAVVSATLTNTGARQGTTVAQVYVGDMEATVPRPKKELRQFAKVTLDPGESREVTFDLSTRAFAFYDVGRGRWLVEKGVFEISVGFSATDIRATAQIELGEVALPR